MNYEQTPKDNIEFGGQNFYHDDIFTSIINPVTVRQMYISQHIEKKDVWKYGRPDTLSCAIGCMMLTHMRHKRINKYNKKKMGQ